MVNLPETYVQRMKAMLGEEYKAYVESFERKASSAIRINALKLTPEEFRSRSPFVLRPVPWIPNGFFYTEEDVPSKHPYYYAGLYYLQEPSAMVPANRLPIAPGDKVLDLCAAPGGKSTELAAKLQGTGLLVANDISNTRAKALLKNLELFGATNCLVVSEPPSKLAERFPCFFDKILVDAPCSGEGMFRKQPGIIKNWEQYGTEYYNKLQKEILPLAIAMLKPGGMLLYSTCTFSPDEDEETVQYVLDEFPEMRLISPIAEDEHEKYRELGFSTGRQEYMQNPNPDITKTIRLFPHKLEGEGHFVALLQKDDGAAEGVYGRFDEYCRKDKLPKELLEFFAETSFPLNTERIYCRDSLYYMVPEGLPSLRGLRILRTGLFLGEVRKGRFEPSQALAMALSKDTYPNCYSLPADDPDVLHYLKCETISPKIPLKDGYALVCVDDYPLGFLKVKGNNTKNKYLPGWRLM